MTTPVALCPLVTILPQTLQVLLIGGLLRRHMGQHGRDRWMFSPCACQVS